MSSTEGSRCASTPNLSGSVKCPGCLKMLFGKDVKSTCRYFGLSCHKLLRIGKDLLVGMLNFVPPSPLQFPMRGVV